MGKYYKKRYYRGNRDKYSVEQTFFNGTVDASSTTSIDVVPAVTFQGMRKVKHLTVTLCPSSNVSMYWALFYLPQGMTAPALTNTSSSPLVEPNQYVMNCGIFDSDAGPQRISSRISRNLNSGDKIVLLLHPTLAEGAGPYTVTGIVRYAITLQ